MRIKNNAFTLLEVLLVIVIIGMFMALVIPRLTGKVNQSRISATKTEIQSNLRMALSLYELDMGVFPSTEQGLKALTQKPEGLSDPSKWKTAYLESQRIPVDPWNH